MSLDHERLDVYRLAVDFAAWAYHVSRGLKGLDRHARDQLLRASQSIALNIAEGCGKRTSTDRAHFFRIAGGSARECGAIIDILTRCDAVKPDHAAEGKQYLVRIVAMLSRLTERTGGVCEDAAEYAHDQTPGHRDAADPENDNGPRT